MSNFLRLKDGAAFYDLVFRQWQASNSHFDLHPLHGIVCEGLVEKVEAGIRPLFDRLGFDSHEEALNHQRAAKSRGLVTTASYSQVTEPIYKRAVGRRQRSLSQMEPVLTVLEPWVQALAYSLDPS